MSQTTKGKTWFLAIKVLDGFNTGIYGVLYRSHLETKENFLEQFDEWCDEIVDPNKFNLIVGDFNINVSSSNFYGDKLLNVIKSNNMKQFVNNFTRSTNDSESIIDLVISNKDNVTCKILNNYKLCDHNMI